MKKIIAAITLTLILTTSAFAWENKLILHPSSGYPDKFKDVKIVAMDEFYVKFKYDGKTYTFYGDFLFVEDK